MSYKQEIACLRFLKAKTEGNLSMQGGALFGKWSQGPEVKEYNREMRKTSKDVVSNAMSNRHFYWLPEPYPGRPPEQCNDISSEIPIAARKRRDLSH